MKFVNELKNVQSKHRTEFVEELIIFFQKKKHVKIFYEMDLRFISALKKNFHGKTEDYDLP